MYQCPFCQATDSQVKAGLHRSGSQRVQCNHCRRRYTPEPNEAGVAETIRESAIRMSIDGINQRRIARTLGVSQGSVSNWVRERASQLPQQADKPPGRVETAELDELFTFVGSKKTKSTS